MAGMKSNDSFRQLIDEVRNAPEKKKAESQQTTSSGQYKKKSQGSEKYRRLMEQKARQKEMEEEGSGYRDRADERRKDKVENTDDSISALANVDIEMSKYLGGDISHTHLVKGLDYALLNKVKSELGKTVKGTSDMQSSESRKETKKTAKFSQGSKKINQVQAGKKVIVEKTKDDLIPTRTPIGKSIAFFLGSALSDTKRIGLNSNNRRSTFDTLAFEFNLHADKFDVSAELPVTILRSKIKLGDEADDDEMMMGWDNEKVVRAAVEALEHYRVSGKKHRPPKTSQHPSSSSLKRPSIMEPPPPSTYVVDDIFEDVGKYVPNLEQDQKRARWDNQESQDKDREGGVGYFENLRGSQQKEEEREREEMRSKVAVDIMKGVKNLAAVIDRRGAREKKKNDDGENMDGDDGKYGETFDFDFAGEAEEGLDER